MLLNPFARRDNPHRLAVSMTGVKMGDRLVQIGCTHGGRFAAVAAKVGLSGRAVAVVPDAAAAALVQAGAAREGVLVEIETAAPKHLPLDDGAFDLAVVDEGAGTLGALPPEPRDEALGEILRVLRPGGRVVIIGGTTPHGLGALLGRRGVASPFVVSGSANNALTATGFRSVRTLAEREGLVFVEGVKPRVSVP